MVVSTAVELIEKTEKERRRVKEAFESIERHYKDMEDGKPPAINSLRIDLQELVNSSQDLFKKAKTCI